MIAMTVGELRQFIFQTAECFFENKIIHPDSIHPTHQVLVKNKKIRKILQLSFDPTNLKTLSFPFRPDI